MWNALKPEFLARLSHSPMNGAVGSAPVFAPPARDWEACIAALNHYRTLTDDWDGQGAILGKPAAPISEELVDSAVALMQSLRSHAVPAPHATYPGVNGTVGASWDLAGGGTVEIEVLDPGTADVYFTTADGKVDHAVLTDETVAA
jgi:hypothetical protein